MKKQKNMTLNIIIPSITLINKKMNISRSGNMEFQTSNKQKWGT